LNYLVGLLINDICLVGVHTFDVVLSLLTTDDEDLILSLDRGGLRWEFVPVSKLNALCRLTGQLMNVKLLGVFIEIVQPWPAWRQDIVRLEADHVVEEAAEFVNLALDLDVGSRVLLEEGVVLIDLHLKLIELVLVVFNCLFLLQDL
jgi:hypothetical protein